MEFSPGGFIPGPPTLVTLDDDECVWDRNLNCLRTDERHHFQMVEAPRKLCQPEGRLERGPCLHRHPVPVESTVDGSVLARLCPICDEQLPA